MYLFWMCPGPTSVARSRPRGVRFSTDHNVCEIMSRPTGQSRRWRSNPALGRYARLAPSTRLLTARLQRRPVAASHDENGHDLWLPVCAGIHWPLGRCLPGHAAGPFRASRPSRRGSNAPAPSYNPRSSTELSREQSCVTVPLTPPTAPQCLMQLRLTLAAHGRNRRIFAKTCLEKANLCPPKLPLNIIAGLITTISSGADAEDYRYISTAWQSAARSRRRTAALNRDGKTSPRQQNAPEYP
jgi:hypothetical protein